ncbi:MAG: hypothetical protein Q8M98_11140 [Candidatus Cloacimonadaceae bacterium]|nr:hypothetical protein [Candidatus Cloacimonadaceae bacterium]MDP3115307.1 hypothetical protein [Candidatus Cloacimonadaceae bacterium]
MRFRHLLSLILAALLFSACAANKPANDKERLRSEMLKWENFSSDGIVQVSYMGLSLRKMFVLNKSKSEVRFDVIDGGAMAMQSKPLLSAYMGEYISIQSPFAPQLEKLSGSLNKQNPQGFFASLDSLINVYGDEIILHKKLSAGGVEIVFDKDLRIGQVNAPESKSGITISYLSNGNPDKVFINLDAKTSIELLFDRIGYGKAEIVPLPRPEPHFNLQQFLEENAHPLTPPSGVKE